MTKADLLKALAGVPMNTPVVFQTEHDEHEMRRAYTGMGLYGFVLILTDGCEPPGELEPESVL